MKEIRIEYLRGIWEVHKCIEVKQNTLNKQSVKEEIKREIR